MVCFPLHFQWNNVLKVNLILHDTTPLTVCSLSFVSPFYLQFPACPYLLSPTYEPLSSGLTDTHLICSLVVFIDLLCCCLHVSLLWQYPPWRWSIRTVDFCKLYMTCTNNAWKSFSLHVDFSVTITMKLLGVGKVILKKCVIKSSWTCS